MSLSTSLKPSARALALALVITTFACSGGDLSTFPLVAGSSGSVATVTIELVAPSVVAGLTTQVEATVKSASGAVLTGHPINWRSSNTTIATISPDGVVSALQPGTTTLTASTGGKSGTAQLIVTRPAVATITLSPTTGYLVVGTSGQVDVSVQDADGNVLSGRNVTWSSSNVLVAAVSTTGLVSALSSGTSVISARSEGVVGQMTAVVVTAQAPVASVTLTPSSGQAYVGESGYFGVVLKDAAGNVLTGRTISWSTSSPTIASVAPNGSVSALAPGSAVITATSEGKSGSAVLTVLQRVAGGGATDLCTLIAGGTIIASNGQFLGSLTNKFNSQSVLNEFGNYGSSFSSTSIWNEFGQYGGQFAAKSPFNPFTSTPPKLFLKNSQTFFWLTVNTIYSGSSVNPYFLKTCTNFP